MGKVSDIIQSSINRIASKLQNCKVFEKFEELDRKTGHCVVFLSGDNLKSSKEQFVSCLEQIEGVTNVKQKTNVVSFRIPVDTFEGVGIDIEAEIKSNEEIEQFQKTISEMEPLTKKAVKAVVSAVLYEKSQDELFKELRILKMPELESNQHLQFTLSDESLDLNIIDEESGEEYGVWESSDVKQLKKLLSGIIDLTEDFDEIVSKISSKGPKMKNKVLSELQIKDREEENVHIEKALHTLGEVENPEETKKVFVFVGKFRPPHALDFNLVQKLGARNDRTIICILRDNKPGCPVSVEQSEKIWGIYKKYLSIPVEIRVVSNVEEIQESLLHNEELAENISFTVASYDQVDNFNGKVKAIPVTAKKVAEKFSFDSTTKAIKFIKKGTFIPLNLNTEDALQVIKELTQPLERAELSESIKEGIRKGVTSVTEGSSGTPVRPATNARSEDKSKMAALYQDLYQQLGEDFDVNFYGIKVVISPKSKDGYMYDRGPLYEAEEMQETEEIDYLPYIVSFIRYVESEGLQVRPLPEIVVNREKQSDGLLDSKTGEYDPSGDGLIKIYTHGRDARSCMRSFSHELYHHHQNLNGKLINLDSNKITESNTLKEVEGECYKESNLLLRGWLESLGKYDK